MSSSPPRLFGLLGTYCAVSAIAAVGLGGLVLLGRVLHMEWLLAVLPGLLRVKVNPAVCFALSGTSLWLLLPDGSPRRPTTARLLALLVALVGAATLGQDLYGLDLRIDQLLYVDPAGDGAASRPGRMSPTIAMAFVAIGSALLLLDRKTRHGNWPAQALSLLAALLAVLAIGGYVYGAPALYRYPPYTEVPLPSAIALLLLSGAVFFARPRTGIAGDLTSDGSGSVTARRFLPTVLCIPILLGWLCLQGQHAGVYGTEVGVALYAIANTLAFSVLGWLSTRKLNEEHGQRSRAEATLLDLNAELERRVADRTATLEQQAGVLMAQAALIDLAQDAIIVRDVDGRILLWSRGAEVMYGWLRAEAVGRLSYELLRAEFTEPVERIQAAFMRVGQWEGEIVHHTRDGTRVIVDSRWTLQRDAAGAPVQVLSINSDITSRRLAESERQALTERLSLATAVAKVGVWEWDIASHTLAWDATMFEMYGIPPMAAVPYERWSARLAPEDLPGVEAAMQSVILEKSQGLVEYRIIMADGSEKTIASVERVVLDARGSVIRLIGVNMDISERREAERALAQSGLDRLRFKDEFLSHVSHELRSPLTAIKQFTSILNGGLAGELNEEQREYLGIILKNIEQLQSMIDDLLEVSRLETGKLSVEPDSVSVADVVTDTLNTVRGAARVKRVAISCDLPEDLPSAFADPTRLRQILIILLDNAIKFTPGGGTVRVQARAQRGPEEAGFLLVEVSDTGSGISPEMRDHVFERLYQAAEATQASRKGLGLGLYICKELVTRQGGRIWATGLPDKGSTFAFTLPVFSLVHALAPLLKLDTWPSDSVALVVLAPSLGHAWPSRQSHEAWSQEAKSLLRRCLVPGLDALLPAPSSEAAERFLVAAFADEPGASALAVRIRRQFERLPGLHPVGLTLSVSYRMLPSVPTQADASTDQIVAHMASRLDEAAKLAAIAA